MRAAQLIAHGSPGTFELRDVPAPRPGPGEVVIDVRACGLNHLDLWLEEAGLPVPVKLPRTPGGEAAGVVSEIGAEVSGWQVGDRVAVQSNFFCGECEFCKLGEESQCRENQLLGVERDGAKRWERVVYGFRSSVTLIDGTTVPLTDETPLLLVASSTGDVLELTLDLDGGELRASSVSITVQYP